VVTLCDTVKNDNQTGIVVRKLLAAGARSWWQRNWKWRCDPEAARCAVAAFFALVAKKYEKIHQHKVQWWLVGREVGIIVCGSIAKW